jgi:hypothetical protein
MELFNDYKSKYLKYKNKYNELKLLIDEQVGGVICSDCGESIRNYDELIIHKRRKHNMGLTLTEHRRKQNAEAAKRRRDLARMGEGGRNCKHCDLMFYDLGYLSTHLIRDHKNILNKEDLMFVKSHIRNPADIYVQSIKELETKFKLPIIRQQFPADKLPISPRGSPIRPAKPVSPIRPVNPVSPSRVKSPIRPVSPLNPVSPTSVGRTYSTTSSVSNSDDKRRRYFKAYSKMLRDKAKAGISGYKCTYCNLRFYDKGVLSSHMLKDHNSLITSNDIKFIKQHLRHNSANTNERILKAEQRLSIITIPYELALQFPELEDNFPNQIDSVPSVPRVPRVPSNPRVPIGLLIAQYNPMLQDELDISYKPASPSVKKQNKSLTEQLNEDVKWLLHPQ